MRLAILGAKFILPLYFYLFPSKKLNNNSNIIVSLTSFPARIKTVWITIESILRQTQPPQKIILWLSVQQFKNTKSLPSSLLKLQKKGVEIRFVEENIMSHKKYYYVMQEYPTSYIITIDDDLLYHSSLIETLYNISTNNHAVACNYAREISHKQSSLLPYNSWKLIGKEPFNTPISSNNIFFGSGGGTIFPPKSLHNDWSKKNLFTQLTPKADDIWLNAMCRLNKTPIIYINSLYDLLPIPIKNNKKLADENLNLNMNDIQINNICTYYKKNIFD